MALSRQLGVIGILGACFFVAVGCGDDEDKVATSGDGGEAGDGGGKAGTAGKSTGGSNNTSGNGGKGGSGGSATAGTANDAGAAGDTVGGAGGSGGSDPVGGMAGEGGSVTSGGAGAGGDAGGGGEGGEPVAKSCGFECEITADCAVEFSTTPKVCDQVSHRCVDSLESCETNNNCVPWMSLWYTSCTTQADCDDFSACVNWEGKGYCASLDEGFCTSPPWGEPTTLPEFGEADPQQINVCFATGARCNAGKCIAGCADPFLGSCDDDGDTCNEVTGLCECETGAECPSGACDNAHCVECVTSEHCSGNAEGNKTCVDGKCRCGSAETCTNDTAAAIAVCE